jgi:hypothetical protein
MFTERVSIDRFFVTAVTELGNKKSLLSSMCQGIRHPPGPLFFAPDMREYQRNFRGCALDDRDGSHETQIG